jgi:uncharacterized membrane protein
MTLLIAGLILFIGEHSISIVNDEWRNRMAARFGQWTWKGFYALVAIAGFVLMVRGYGLARMDPTVLYVPPQWLHPFSMVLLIPVFPLLFAAYLPGRIKAVARHPMLVATMLWAAAHLLLNGTLADVLLFGAFLIWAAADRLSLLSRTPRAIPGAPSSRYNDAIAVVLGLALHAAFILGLHEWLIGIPAMTG